jgi:LPS sulfotransferase NodH
MTTIIICTLPRTGSTLLAETMAGTGVLGAPDEFFHHKRRKKLADRFGVPVGDLAGYANAVAKSTGTSNGVTAVKLMGRQLERLVESGDLETPALRSFLGLFDDARIITLFRRDKLRQALSLLRAHQTGQWQRGDERATPPKYEKKLVRKMINRVIRLEGRWDREMKASGVTPDLRLEYEDVTSDMKVALGRIAALAGVALPDDLDIGEPPTKRQRDALTEEWVDRFLDG